MIITSEASNDLLTVDPTSKAIRSAIYSLNSRNCEEKSTYCASNRSVFNVPTGIFFTLSGSGSKLLRVTHAIISGFAVTTLAAQNIFAEKWRFRTSVTGLGEDLVIVPLDSNDPASSVAVCHVYSITPPVGSELVGRVNTITSLYKAVATPFDGDQYESISLQFGDKRENRGVSLKGADETFTLSTTIGGGSSMFIEWTEE